MSTRCQVRTIEAGLPWNNEDHNVLMMYHHWDGYPTNMLKLILEGYEKAIAPRVYEGISFKYDKSWEAGRSGKAAAYIISTDPGGFEPESGNEFHADIEWFYEVVCVNHKQGVPTWEVRVFTTMSGFWDNPDRDHLAEVASGNIINLARDAEKIENRQDSAIEKRIAKPKKVRTEPTIGSLVETFVSKNTRFNAADLRKYIAFKLKGKPAPASSDRILRDLRAEGKINYRVVNRRESLYEVLPVAQQANQA